MKVKIFKCSQPTYWYADKIGQVYNVEISGSDYKVIPGNELSTDYICIKDARPLKTIEAKKTPLKVKNKVKAASRSYNNRSDEIAFLLKIKAAYIGKFDTSQDQNFFVIDIDERVAQLRAVR